MSKDRLKQLPVLGVDDELVAAALASAFALEFVRSRPRRKRRQGGVSVRGLNGTIQVIVRNHQWVVIGDEWRDEDMVPRRMLKHIRTEIMNANPGMEPNTARLRALEAMQLAAGATEPLPPLSSQRPVYAPTFRSRRPRRLTFERVYH